MALIRDYVTAMYDWLSQFATTFRQPVLDSMFDDNNPKPNEYITYSADVGNFNEDYIQAITVYSKSTGYGNVMSIVDAIENAIGEDGAKIEEDWGYITVYKGSPFYQDKEDEDSSYRAGYVNLLVRVCQNNVLKSEV